MFNLNCACRMEEASKKLSQKAKEMSQLQLGQIQNTAQALLDDLHEALNIPIEKRGSKIVRSSAGQPPRKDSGLLRDSVFVSLSSSGTKAVLWAGIKGKAALYAKYLEYGTSQMAARPFLQPSLSKRAQLLKSAVRSLSL